MKHSTAELIDIACRYYPRGIARARTPSDDPAPYKNSDEHRRLVAARVEAAARRGPWRAMLTRLREQFPGRGVNDQVACCPPDFLRASYEACIELPPGPGEHGHTVSFLVSFLVPYYVVYATRFVDDPEQEAAIRRRHEKKVLLGVGGEGEPRVVWALPREVVKPEVLAEIDRDFEKRQPATRMVISFELSPEEQPYAATIAREIEATYGYEPMPPEVGRTIVPDIETDFRPAGEATLYDALFTESW